MESFIQGPAECLIVVNKSLTLIIIFVDTFPSFFKIDCLNHGAVILRQYHIMWLVFKYDTIFISDFENNKGSFWMEQSAAASRDITVFLII